MSAEDKTLDELEAHAAELRKTRNQLFEQISTLLIAAKLVDDEFLKNNKTYVMQCIHPMRERIKQLNDFTENAQYFFKDPVEYDEDVMKKYWFKEGVIGRLYVIFEKLKELENWSSDNIEKIVRDTANDLDIGAGKLIHPIRLALTGWGTSPGLFKLMQVLDKDVVLRRIENALNFLKKKD